MSRPAPARRSRSCCAEHGYTRTAPGTRTTVGLIDLVFVDLGSPWAMAILAGVEEVAYRAGTGVAVSAVHGRHRTRPDDRWLENLATRRSDGVLLILSELTAAPAAAAGRARRPGRHRGPGRHAAARASRRSAPPTGPVA